MIRHSEVCALCGDRYLPGVSTCTCSNELTEDRLQRWRKSGLVMWFRLWLAKVRYRAIRPRYEAIDHRITNWLYKEFEL